MAASRRRLILEAFTERLRAIQINDGYETDAGHAVYLGETPQLGPDDPEVVVAVVVGEEEPQYQGANLFIRLPVVVQVVARADLDQPWLSAEAGISDVKKAVELEDRTLGGLVKRQIERGSVVTLEREPGSAVIGFAVTYICPYVEGWGTP